MKALLALTLLLLAGCTDSGAPSSVPPRTIDAYRMAQASIPQCDSMMNHQSRTLSVIADQATTYERVFNEKAWGNVTRAPNANGRIDVTAKCVVR